VATEKAMETLVSKLVGISTSKDYIVEGTRTKLKEYFKGLRKYNITAKKKKFDTIDDDVATEILNRVFDANKGTVEVYIIKKSLFGEKTTKRIVKHV
jgi:hypothetical protein